MEGAWKSNITSSSTLVLCMKEFIFFIIASMSLIISVLLLFFTALLFSTMTNQV